MRNRLPMIFSTTAMLVAVFGSTPIGEAAWNQIVPPNSVGTPQLKRGAVGTLQLKRNAVKARQLAPNAVRTAQVVNGSLLTVDFKAGQIPQGPKGDKGDTGAQGPSGLSGVQIVTADSPNNTTIGLREATATCPSGKKVIGGGAQSISSPAYSSTGFPVGDNAWKAVAYSPGAALGVKAYAICATTQ